MRRVHTRFRVLRAIREGNTQVTRSVRNFGPALVALTLAMTTMGGLAIAAGSSGSSSASAAPSPSMLNRGIYGPGVGYDVKANLWIGGSQGQKVAIRFKATTTSALNSVRFVQRGGTGYSLGTGGTMTLSVRADDGAGHPSATSLAQQSYTPGNPAGAWEKYDPVTFSSPATLTAATIYYIVFTNTSTSNYISVNSVYNYDTTPPRQPMFSDSEYGLMYTSGSWGAPEGRYTPVVDLAYANGTHDGQSYYEAMIANYATISGASNMARERFTVSGGDRTVGSASLRLRRSGGTSPLIMTLETSAGAAIESVTVPAASIPVSAPGGANGGSVWVTANFSSPRVLSNGSSYNLRMSTASDTTYTTFPVRPGTSKGLATYAFSDGTGQSTTNGSTWTDLYLWDHEDLQFYFTLVPAAAHTRLAGADRYATAVAISQSAFQPQNPGDPFPVTVASSANFPDALAAGPVAAASGGPLLLVPSDGALPTAVSTELTRLNPSRVNIAGGTAAVSDLVQSELQAFGADNVLTWAGQSRYETAAQLAGITNGGLGKTVFIATGASFPDALGGSAAAGQLGGALMLTNRSALPAATASALTSGKPTKVVILGGEAVIDPAVLSQVKALLPSTPVERWFGADRFATAAAISSNTYPQGATTAYLASAADYPDALAGAPVAARAGAPLLLTSRDCVPVSTLAELHRLGANKIVVLGGTNAVSDAAADLTPCAG